MCIISAECGYLMCYKRWLTPQNYKCRPTLNKLFGEQNWLIERIWLKQRNCSSALQEQWHEYWISTQYVIYGVGFLPYLVLVMTIWVRSRSALLDLSTSSLSLSGRDSIASAARLACFRASSLVLCIPLLLPRYSRAWMQKSKCLAFSFRPTNKLKRGFWNAMDIGFRTFNINYS